MAIYYFIWFYIFLNVIFFQKNKTITKLNFKLFFIFITIFIGLRYEVGGDWWNYLSIYDSFEYQSFLQSIFISDVGYSILNFLSVKLEIADTVLVNFCCALIISIFLYLAFIKLEKYWLMMLLYYPYHLLVVSLGYTRQAVALAIITYAFTCLIDKRNVKFLLYVLFACLFHKTAIILLMFLPLSFIQKIKQKKFLFYFYCLFSLFIILSLVYISMRFGENIYTNSDTELSSSGVFMRLSMHFIPIFLYFSYRNKFNQNRMIVLDYFLFMIFLCTILAFSFSTLADRFNLYLIFFDLFIFSFVFNNLKKKNEIFFSFILFVNFTLYIYIWMSLGEWASKAWIPYQNYISNYLFDNAF